MAALLMRSGAASSKLRSDAIVMINLLACGLVLIAERLVHVEQL